MTLDWNKRFAVLAISRLSLRSLGFSEEQISHLTDEEMQAIADTLQENLLHAAGIDFSEEVTFIARIVLAEKGDQP